MDTATYTAIMMTIGAVIGINVLFLLVIMRAVARDRETLVESGEAPAQPVAPAATYDPACFR